MLARIDHLVLTVASIERSVAFYCQVLGLREERFGDNRVALAGPGWKINLHQVDRTFEPKAQHPTPGSADLCFIADRPLAETIDLLSQVSAPIELGPLARTGALGPITSIYLRDPDGNLIEISEYQ